MTAREDADDPRRWEERFRRFFELGLIGMFISFPDKGYGEVNDRYCEILGYEREELRRLEWPQTTHPDDLPADIVAFDRMMAGEIDGCVLEKRSVRKDGRIIDTTLSVTCLRRDDGTVDYFVGLLEDTTDRKRDQEALRQANEQIRRAHAQSYSILESIRDGFYAMDADFNLTYVNRTAEELAGKRREDLIGHHFWTEFPMAIGTESYERHMQAMADRKSVYFETYSSITKRWVGIMMYPALSVGDGGNGGLSVFFHDITERRKSEAALRESAQALREANEALEMRVTARTAALEEALAERQELLRRIVQTQEDERRHISRELHDQTGQHLSGLVLGLQALEESIGRYCPPEAGAETQIGQLRDIATALAQDIHRMAVDLRPTALDDLGLVPVLETHIAHWSESSGIPSEFDAFGLDKRESGGAGESGGPGESAARLPSAVETTVFRVVQEALTNVARHGTDPATRATRVSVTLQVRGDQLQATIEDNGPGFAVEAARRSGRLGLVGMEERAASVGGTLDIESEPGEGTTVYLRIPLAP